MKVEGLGITCKRRKRPKKQWRPKMSNNNDGESSQLDKKVKCLKEQSRSKVLTIDEGRRSRYNVQEKEKA